MRLQRVWKKTKNYRFLFCTLSSILLGSITGIFFPHFATKIKPLGDLFLNILFILVVPLVFFSISSVIANMTGWSRLWKIVSRMILTFFMMSVIASLWMILLVKLFPPAKEALFTLPLQKSIPNGSHATLTLIDVIMNLGRENMIGLILLSSFVGTAVSLTGEKGKAFSRFLSAGSAISMKAISLVMYYAPIGFFAYFAVLISSLGTSLLNDYFKISLLYYAGSFFYFIMAFSAYAYFANPKKGISLFWNNLLLPSATAIATCSSAASIPANMEATLKMGVSNEVCDIVIPLGSILHKQGSILGGVLKIAFLFGVYHLSFSSLPVLLLASAVGIAVGTVMGAIPGGGMIGEMLILSIYGFPSQSLMMIAAISMIIDPPATLLNVIGNSVASMIVQRLSTTI